MPVPPTGTVWDVNWRRRCSLPGRLRCKPSVAACYPSSGPVISCSVRMHDVGAARPGDIVVFRRDGRLVTHRLVERTIRQDRIQWITRGDRMRHDDAPVSEFLGESPPSARRAPLTPQQSMTGRLAAWILGRSDLATQVLFTVRTWDPDVIRQFGEGNEILLPSSGQRQITVAISQSSPEGRRLRYEGGVRGVCLSGV